ncbi:16S rRNA (uracil(1498)-N(3))-methyltransferase [Prolixibacteraceae bacterium JC049]|nr:16S rRNA (uracil(1498)-N(3))-methyltransferase [Prolixibacteraceae bacterium JC049]
MHLFYTPDISGDSYTLSETESKHAVKVLRLQQGAQIQLMDGKGHFFIAEIEEAIPKRCKVRIVEKQAVERRPFSIHIAIAPTKNIDRLEWFLEKCTEIGIDKITPLLCEHSERKVIKSERLEKVIVSACKQSLQAYMPELAPLTPVKELLENATEKNKCIAHCEEQEKYLLKNIAEEGDDLLILIGPEGDFSLSEIQLAQQNEFMAVSLGESRLRTETAGVCACHTIHVMKQ